MQNNKKTNKIFSIIGYGSLPSQIKSRDEKRICTSIGFDKFNESEFYCNNICYPYKVSILPFTKPKDTWLKESMICSECLKKLKNKYNINFKNKILLWVMSKGWNEDDYKNHKDYQLIRDLKTKININSHEIHFNPEIIWWNNLYFLKGVPCSWLKNFIVYKLILKGNNEQALLNGPDYIFKDMEKNKLIGFEIVSCKWNIFIHSIMKIQ